MPNLGHFGMPLPYNFLNIKNNITWAPQNRSFVELRYHSCGANQYLNYLGKCYGSGSFNTHLTFVKPFKDFGAALRQQLRYGLQVN